MIKPRLIPVPVPWMVTPSTPFLHVHISEDPHEDASYVQFVAYFGPFMDQGAAYRVMRIILEPGVWLSIMPGGNDADPIDWSRFDTRLVPADTVGIQDAVHQGHEMWQRTGLCPDPGMYEVEGSEWLNRAGMSVAGYKHVIIVGHDYYVEALTKGWKPEPGEFLTGEAWK